MSPELWQRVKPLFDAASEMDAAERGPYVVRMCAGDDELRRELERLLEQLGAESSIGGKLPRDIFLPHEPPPSGPTLLPGELLAGRFEILRFVDKGGMGEVYEASDREFGGSVALKTLRPALVHDEVSLNRFKREVLLAKRVGHKNLCRIFDGGWHRAGGKEIAFLTMEFLRGRTLAAHLTDLKVRTGAEALLVLRQIAEGLVALHEAAIIHRDLKPGNVILVPAPNGPARAVITDFGLARLVDQKNEEARVTHTPGFPIGTPEYMAPEQLAGEKDTDLGPYSDVYAFGTVAYEMLCGRLPFTAASAGLLTVQKLTTEPPRPTAIIPEITTGWEKFILRCLEREPGERIQTAAELLQWLEELETEPQPERSLLTTVGGNEAVVPVRTKDLPSSPTQPIDAPKHEIIPIEEPLPPRAVPRWAAALAVAAGLVIGVLALLQWPPVRTPLLRSLCVQFPGTAMFCELPADKDLAILPFTVDAADPKAKALATGLVQYLNDSFYQLYPNKGSMCVHIRNDQRAEGVKLSLQGKVETGPKGIHLTASLREASNVRGRDGLVLRTVDRTIGVNDMAAMYSRLLADIGEAMELEYPTQTWRAWRNAGPRSEESFEDYLIGLGLIQTGQPAQLREAAEHLNRAIDYSRDFTFVHGYVALGDTYRLLYTGAREARWAANAKTAYDRAVSIDRAKLLPSARRGLAQLAHALGQTEEAIALFEDALSQNPYDHTTQLGLAAALEAAGRGDDTERLWRQAIERKPECWLVKNAAADYYSRHGQYAKAEAELLDVIELAPTNSAAFHNLAYNYIKLGRNDDAIHMAARATELGQSPLAYSTLGKAYLYRGCYDDALVNLRYATKAAHKQESNQRWMRQQMVLWGNLGQGLEAISGHEQEAQAAFSNAVQIAEEILAADSNNTLALRVLALASVHLNGSTEQALRHIERGLALASADAEMLFSASVVYEIAGRRGDALRSLELSLRAGMSIHEANQTPALRDLRFDSRYGRMLSRLGLNPDPDPGGITLPQHSPGCPQSVEPGRDLVADQPAV